MRTILFILIIFRLNGLLAEDKTFSISGSYYRLENIDSLNKYSLDSIRGDLQFYSINDSIIESLIFPIMIFKTFDSWTNDNLFNFVISDKYFIGHIESLGKLRKCNGRYSSVLKFFKRDRANFENKINIDSSLFVNINFKNDSIWINNKLFKEDKTGRIFQRFTGY